MKDIIKVSHFTANINQEQFASAIGTTRIAHDKKQRRSLRITFLSAAQRIQLQLIVYGDLPRLRDVKRCSACSL